MARRKISKEKIINAFLFTSFDKSAGATSLQNISDILNIKKASLYNHFSGRDKIYSAVIDYCSFYLENVNFLPDILKDKNKFLNEDIFFLFEKLVKRYIKLYESEPLFQIYTFINTERFFNKEASDITEAALLKISNDTKKILISFIDTGKIQKKSKSEINFFSQLYASLLFQKIDFYIMHKKELIRKNPECTAGSLFAMPTDDSELNEIIKISETTLRCFIPTEENNL